MVVVVLVFVLRDGCLHGEREVVGLASFRDLLKPFSKGARRLLYP
jgi:hypothetical protein